MLRPFDQSLVHLHTSASSHDWAKGKTIIYIILRYSFGKSPLNQARGKGGKKKKYMAAV